MASNNYIRDGMVAQILSNATATTTALDMSFNSVYNSAIGTKVLDFPETNDEAWLSHLEIRKKEGNIEIIKQLIKA
jgi:hypothetical protein